MKKKITFVSGNFNILHPGHLRLLKFAKSITGYLIVGVNSNKIAGSAANIDEKLRLESVRSCSYVDHAVLITNSLKHTLMSYKPNVIVKGKEYENLENEELKLLKKFNGKLIFSSGEVTFTSQDLIQKEISETQILNLPKSYIKNHKINFIRLRKILNNFKNQNVAVLGDLIIDNYIFCQPIGMSQEDNSLVVKESNETKFIGGAGIVALHAEGLGAKVDFFSVAGNDDELKFAKRKLNTKRLKSYIFTDNQRPTTLKKRFKFEDQTMFRSSKLYQNSISKEIQNKVIKKITEKINKYDLIVFSDFNYGFVTQNIVDKITQLGKKKRIVMVADSQSSSQDGNISRFKDMNLITPTEREARLACRNNEDGLIVLTSKLREECRAKNIIIKLGPLGMIIDVTNSKKDVHETDEIPILNRFPKDVVGAGDSLLILTALSLATGASPWEAAFLGSIASGIQVGKNGNIPLSLKEIHSNIKK